MEKNIENLLFSLAETHQMSEVQQISSKIKKHGVKLSGGKDLISATITQSEESLEKSKVEISWYPTSGVVEKNSIVIDTCKISNFLTFAYQVCEKQANKEFTDDFGLPQFNELKDEVLRHLSGKETKRLIPYIDPSYKDKDKIQFNFEDHETNFNCFAEISQEEINKTPTMGAVKVIFATVLKKLSTEGNPKFFSARCEIYIPKFKLEEYQKLDFKIEKDKNEVQFLDSLFNNPQITTKDLAQFKLNTELAEKPENIVKMKL